LQTDRLLPAPLSLCCCAGAGAGCCFLPSGTTLQLLKHLLMHAGKLGIMRGVASVHPSKQHSITQHHLQHFSLKRCHGLLERQASDRPLEHATHERALAAYCGWYSSYCMLRPVASPSRPPLGQCRGQPFPAGKPPHELLLSKNPARVSKQQSHGGASGTDSGFRGNRGSKRRAN
jgi:hypothetical protein